MKMVSVDVKMLLSSDKAYSTQQANENNFTEPMF